MDAMQTVYTANGVTWVDLAQPTADEVREVMETYDVDPLIAEEIGTPTPRPHFAAHNGQLFWILHFPVARHTHEGESNQQEVDCIVTESACITVRYETVDPIHKFAKMFEVDATLARSERVEHGGMIAVALLRKLYAGVTHELEYLQDALTEIERSVFAGKERAMVRELSVTNRELLNFEQTLKQHHEILTHIDTHLPTLFGERITPLMAHVHSTYRHAIQLVEQQKGSCRELRETNDSLLYTKQNEIMKTLTIMAFVTFPLTLLTGIFGMNTQQLPIVGRPNDFWIITGIMLVMTALFFVFFRYKQWL